MTLIVEAIDVNDNPPIFTDDNFRFQLMAADSLTGTTVGRVTAYDADMAAGNRAIRYDIGAGNDNGEFHIDSTSGIQTISCTE